MAFFVSPSSPAALVATGTRPAGPGLAVGALTRRLIGRPADAGGEPDYHYWPRELLNAFSLEMAAHGICVNASMMLGDAAYAHQKLAQAQALADASVNELVGRMRAYFEVGATHYAQAGFAISADRQAG